MVDWKGKIDVIRALAEAGKTYREIALEVAGSGRPTMIDYAHDFCKRNGISNNRNVGRPPRKLYVTLPTDTPVHPMFVSPCCNAPCWNTCGKREIPTWLLPTWWTVCERCSQPCDPVKRK